LLLDKDIRIVRRIETIAIMVSRRKLISFVILLPHGVTEHVRVSGKIVQGVVPAFFEPRSKCFIPGAVKELGDVLEHLLGDYPVAEEGGDFGVN
jgi:hypothetical protein